MDILKLIRIETRPNTSIPFYELTSELKDHLKTRYWDTGIQIGDEFKLSEDGLTRTRTATYIGVPSLIEILSADPELTNYQTIHRAYCEAHGITRSNMLFEIYSEDGTLIMSGENPSA